MRQLTPALFAIVALIGWSFACTGNDPVTNPFANQDGGASSSSGTTSSSGNAAGSFKLKPVARAIVTQNTQAKIPIEIERLNGFAGPVTLSIDPLPAETSAPAVTLDGTTTTGELTLTATGTAPHASLLTKAIAKSGDASESTDVEVIVRGELGALDTSYGERGKSIIAGEITWDFALAPDGSVVVARESSLVRVLPNGKQDLSFGVNGVAAIDQPKDRYKIAMLPDGSIIAVVRNEEQTNCSVQKFTAGGAVDTTFGTNGKTTVAFPAGEAVVYSIGIDSQNRLYINLSPDHTLRVDAMGTLETAFDGTLTTTLLSVRHIKADGDGLLGFGYGRNGTDRASLGLSRLTGAASAHTQVSASWSNLEANDAFITRSKGFWIAGAAQGSLGEHLRGVLAHFLPNGEPDESFANGEVYEELTPPDNLSFLGVVEDAADRPVVIGERILDSDGRRGIVMYRYLANGSLDAAFGTGGKIIEPVDDGYVRGARLVPAINAVIVVRSLMSNVEVRRYWL